MKRAIAALIELIKKYRKTTIAISSVFLIIIVPLIINQLYKCESGYMTLWDAPDVLAYYGTILGSFATLLAVVFTIRFTRKQIRIDYYIQKQSLSTETNLKDINSIVNTLRPASSSPLRYGLYPETKNIADIHIANLYNQINQLNDLISLRDKTEASQKFKDIALKLIFTTIKHQANIIQLCEICKDQNTPYSETYASIQMSYKQFCSDNSPDWIKLHGLSKKEIEVATARINDLIKKI